MQGMTDRAYRKGDQVRIARSAAAETVLLYDGWVLDSGYTPTVDLTRHVQLSELASTPAHAGPRGGRFDPARSIYNAKASNTRRVRAAMGRALAGTGLCRLTFVGDSLSVGFPSIPGTTDPVTLLGNSLAATGLPVGTLVDTYNNEPDDPRITLSGGWGDGGSNFPYVFTTVAGSTLTVTGSGTVLEVVSSAASGAWTVAIDGAAPVTFAPAGPNVPQTLTITGLTAGAHTAVITTPNAWTGFYAAGFRPATGVVLQNAAISGGTTTVWRTVNSGFGPAEILNAPTYFDIDAVFLELGANDLNGATAVGTFETNLYALAASFRGTGADVILGASHPIQGADTTFLPYLSAIYDVADSLDLPLVDFADRIGNFAAREALGLTTDTTHVSAAANGMKAAAWRSLLAS